MPNIPSRGTLPPLRLPRSAPGGYPAPSSAAEAPWQRQEAAGSAPGGPLSIPLMSTTGGPASTLICNGSVKTGTPPAENSPTDQIALMLVSSDAARARTLGSPLRLVVQTVSTSPVGVPAVSLVVRRRTRTASRCDARQPSIACSYWYSS